MPQFERYIGIDYSGAKTPTESLPGLRVYAADWVMPPREVPPPLSPRKYWTRRGLAEWLVTQLSGGKPMLVGLYKISPVAGNRRPITPVNAYKTMAFCTSATSHANRMKSPPMG